MAITNDGKYLYTADWCFAYWGKNEPAPHGDSSAGYRKGTIQLWSILDQKYLTTIYSYHLRKGGAITHMVVTPDNRFLYTAGHNGMMCIEISTQKQLSSFKCFCTDSLPCIIEAMAVTKDSRF